jgi:tRNA U34 5-methylaminomethyl-2-thiouridine-forming methyltransferase MnmC
MDELEIIVTSDGSHTLRNRKLDETYHSIHGAKQESTHVFIKNGLSFYCESSTTKEVSVLEVGFGTGLNALLTWEFAAANNIKVHYTTIEPYPLPAEVWTSLNYGEKNQQKFDSIHRAEWDEEVTVAPEFTLLKRKVALQEAALAGKYNVVYFDAFAPSVQPELWIIDSLASVVGTLSDGAVFVTYSAKGQLKRDLKTLGLAVETLPGPPGKLQMVRGIMTRKQILL